MSIWNNSEKNKNFLSKFALFLLTISIIGCIFAILDYHFDLHTEPGKGSNSQEWNNFLYGYNWVVVIGNSLYILLAIHRYLIFTKSKNTEIIKRSLSYKLLR